MSKLVGVEELAKQIECSVSTVRRAIKRGDIPYSMRGNRYKFDVEEVRESLKEEVK